MQKAFDERERIAEQEKAKLVTEYELKLKQAQEAIEKSAEESARALSVLQTRHEEYVAKMEAALAQAQQDAAHGAAQALIEHDRLVDVVPRIEKVATLALNT